MCSIEDLKKRLTDRGSYLKSIKWAKYNEQKNNIVPNLILSWKIILKIHW